MQPWTNREATDAIRQMGSHSDLDLSYTAHVKERMWERDLWVSDLLYILRNGFVFGDPEPATQPGLFKYKIETRTPNSNNRSVRLVVIPDQQRCWIKVVTIMWVDE